MLAVKVLKVRGWVHVVALTTSMACFCKQGIDAAYTELEQLAASYHKLAAKTPQASPANETEGDVSMLPDELGQAEQQLVACKEDIVSLLTAS